MNLALIKDINREYLEAVKYYEEEINNSDLPKLDAYINLAFLYWEFAAEQFEFNMPNNIPEEWSVIGGKRFSKIIDMGLKKYPNSIELHFWKKYLPYRLFSTDFSKNECERLLKVYGKNISLVPYFFLYLFDKEKHKEKIARLTTVCNDVPTAKNLYIKSIIS